MCSSNEHNFQVIVSFVSMFSGMIVLLLAREPELLYLAGFFTMLHDGATLGIRVTLTKLVEPDEVGKVFACIGALQAGINLISPLYNLIYAATLEWHLGFVYCLSETLLVGMIIAAMYSYFYIKKHGIEKQEERVDKNHNKQTFEDMEMKVA